MRRFLVMAVVAVLATAGCGGGDDEGPRYEYSFVLQTRPDEVKGAKVVVDGEKQGVLAAVEPQGAATRATVKIDSRLTVAGTAELCAGELHIVDRGSRSQQPALNGHTFSAEHTLVSPGGCH